MASASDGPGTQGVPWPERLLEASVSLEVENAECAILRDWSLTRPRDIDRHVIWYIADGERQIEVDGCRHVLRDGSLVWFSPRTPHLVAAVPNARPPSVFAFRFDLRSGGRAVGFPGMVIAHERQDLRQTCERLLEEVRFGAQLWRRRFLAQLFLLFTDLVRDGDRTGRASFRLDRIQRRELDRFARGRMLAGATPADLAAHIGLSPDYFARCFRRSYGCSPRRWLVEQRIRRAAHLLMTTVFTVGQIARRCGYDDMNLFSRQFRMLRGCSPTAFRASAAADRTPATARDTTGA